MLTKTSGVEGELLLGLPKLDDATTNPIAVGAAVQIQIEVTSLPQVVEHSVPERQGKLERYF